MCICLEIIPKNFHSICCWIINIESCPDNWPLIIAPWMIAPGLLLPENYPEDNCPLTIYPQKFPTRKIVFQMICRLHNCHSDKWPEGKLLPMKIVPMINYTRDIFSPRIRNRSTLIDSLLDFDFYIRKNFINTVRLKILKTKEQARTNWVWNNETDFFMLLQQIETDKVYH